ncbi:hypothetical protein T265_01867 [Opisthorchis viverrini]|uniref:Uncharacterized protein n=1 Tax=Opisthorchis viverrini TaxID=6198 RepID=A0A075A0Z5_OPIVI|nr:hypothetical protein T265_01867 [Opisthorchis viverrini]KER31932.1 hypothetical protein T265_01867 [Opisthorchis viverrini]
MVGVLTCLMGVLGILLARRYRQQYQQRHVSRNRNEKRPCPTRPNSLGIAPNGSLARSSKCGRMINSSSSSDKCSSLLGRNNHLWLNLHTYSNPLVTTNLMQHDRPMTGNSGPGSVLCSCVEAGQIFDPDNGSHVLTSCRDGTIYRSLVRNNNTIRKTEPGSLLRPQDFGEVTRCPPVPLTFPIEDSIILGGKPRNPLPQTFMPLHPQPTWMHTETNATHKPEMELRISENRLTPTYVSALRVDSNPASQFDPLNIDVHS